MEKLKYKTQLDVAGTLRSMVVGDKINGPALREACIRGTASRLKKEGFVFKVLRIDNNTMSIECLQSPNK